MAGKTLVRAAAAACVLVVAVVGVAAAAADMYIRSEWSEAQGASRASPIGTDPNGTLGVGTDKALSIEIIIEADSGQTLTGTGTVAVYYGDKWDGTAFDWALYPGIGIPVPSACASLRRCVVGSYAFDGPRKPARILPATSGVGVSSGGVTMRGFVTTSGLSSSY